jgi:hypothetical protein
MNWEELFDWLIEISIDEGISEEEIKEAVENYIENTIWPRRDTYAVYPPQSSL